MDKTEFKPVIESWIKFHNKKFKGEDASDDESMLRRHMQVYYAATSYMSANELNNGFLQASKHFEYYPKIPQLLKFCPNEKKKEEFIDYKALPQSKEAKELMRKALEGTNIYRQGDEAIRNNFALIARRWPNTNWGAALAREIDKDNHRLKREV